ncbi:MAG: MarC family NAAT transporter [Burkholderiales bacterium]|nr:MarC family NAAT transporter [Burkholderiales bacterium]
MLSTLFVQYLVGGFISLIVITNPVSKIPLYISLTQGMSLGERKKQANWACYYAAAIMIISLAAGNLLLIFFGISYGALRIAGGFVVGLIGYQMLFGSRDQLGAPVVRRNKEDYSFFPLAMPGISGPGTIAVVIGIATEIVEIPDLVDMVGAFVMTGGAIVLTCLVTWGVLRSADYISTRLGSSGTQVLTKLMGFLLICIGVQFIASGIRTFIAGS